METGFTGSIEATSRVRPILIRSRAASRTAGPTLHARPREDSGEIDDPVEMGGRGATAGAPNSGRSVWPLGGAGTEGQTPIIEFKMRMTTVPTTSVPMVTQMRALSLVSCGSAMMVP